jgi:glycosyltransferase involved in cell wall biosynthesis
MVQRPLVSVIVPFLNPGRFLDEAIQSVFAQTYTRWELLLVDDGSNDGSSAAAQQYALQHPDKIRTLEHEHHINRGQSASRNLGIRNARGELLAFLDSDDVWLPHKLEHQIGIFSDHPPIGMVCGSSLYWHSWAQSAHDADRVVAVGGPQDVVSEPPRLLLDLYPLGRGGAPCPTSVVVRRDICERVGGFEEPFDATFSPFGSGDTREMYEDQAFLTKIYLETPVFVSSLCCDYYRQNPSSVSSEVFRRGQYGAARLNYLNWLGRFLAQTGCDDGEVWVALHRALYMYRHPVKWFLSEMRSEPRKQLRAVGGYMMRRSMPEGAVRWLRHRLRRRDPPPTPTPQDRQEGQPRPPPAEPGPEAGG